MSFRRDIIECIIAGWNRDFKLKIGSLTTRNIADFIDKNSGDNTIEKITEYYHDVIDLIEEDLGIGNVVGYFEIKENILKFENDFLARIK